jgi:hypothetical protein
MNLHYFAILRILKEYQSFLRISKMLIGLSLSAKKQGLRYFVFVDGICSISKLDFHL